LEGTSLELNEVRATLQEKYNLDVLEVEKVKNVYKVRVKEGIYCLKVIKYEFSHFWFILNVILHLQKSGFERIPEIIKTKSGKDYIFIDGKYAYLTTWLDARECNYDNPVDIEIAAKKLGEFHIKSSGFEVTEAMNPRIGWFKWIENFKTRKNEILDFKKRIMQKEQLTDFDKIYLGHISQELERCDNAVEHLIESDYISIMKAQVLKREICHHDFAHHNVLIEANGTVNFIDFDYTILDTHLHDLSSFLIRRMKNGKWDMFNALHLLDAYNSINPIHKSDIPMMAAFMEFPQDFWQVGIQYYWEKKSWGEDFFIKKLTKICDDAEDKQEFIEEFRCFQYTP
jgi:CotS family spore coat protein